MNTSAFFVTTITVNDPETLEAIELAVYKEESGGMFALDIRFLAELGEQAFLPFGNGAVFLDPHSNHQFSLFDSPTQPTSR